MLTPSLQSDGPLYCRDSSCLSVAVAGRVDGSFGDPGLLWVLRLELDGMVSLTQSRHTWEKALNEQMSRLGQSVGHASEGLFKF